MNNNVKFTNAIDFTKQGKFATISSWANKDCKLLNFKEIHGIGLISDDDFELEINNVKFEHKNNGKKIKSLEVHTTKDSYLNGLKYQPLTSTVDATYEEDRVVNNIGGYTFNTPSAFSEEKHEVVYKTNYNDHETSTTLTIEIKKATGIEFSSLPQKTTFKEGETIDLTGLQVDALFGDEKIENVTYSVDQTIAYLGLDKVLTTYAGITKELPIQVTAYEKQIAMFDHRYCIRDSEGNAALKDGYYTNNGTIEKEGDSYFYHHADTTGWKSSRFNFSDGGSLNLQAVSKNCPDAKIFIKYKATEGDKLSLDLMNRVTGSTWDNAYTTIETTICSDGTWHVASYNLADFDKEYQAHLDNSTELPTETLNFKAINGWLLIGKGNVEISDISVKWDGEEIKGDFDDKAAPKLHYNGEKEFNLHEGDDALDIQADAYDIIDGVVEVEKIYSEGTFDENGKFLPGDHTLILRATDKAGNQTNNADYTIKIHVEANQYHATIISDKGSVTLSKDEFVKGDEVTITITLNDGYEVDKIVVTDKDGTTIPVSENKFIAVGSDVTITVTYKVNSSKNYTL